MKRGISRFTRFLLLIGIGLILALPAMAQDQTVERFGAFGLGYFSQATPQFQGWAALAIPVTGDGRAVSYTAYDIGVVPDDDPTSQLMVAGRRIRYTMKTGLGYRIYQAGTWALYGLAAPGFVADGQEFKSAFTYGGFVHKSIGKGWGALFALTNEMAGGQSDLAPRIGITRKF